MKKPVIIKLICIDALAILLLPLLTNACLFVKWSFANFLSGSVYATSFNLYVKVVVTDNLAFYLFIVYALLFSWVITRLCNSQEKIRLVVLNDLVFFFAGCLLYVLLFYFSQGTFLGLLFFPQDGFLLLPGVIIVTLVQPIVAALFHIKKGAK